MQKINYNPRSSIQLRRDVEGYSGGSLYVVTEPIRFYTSAAQTLFHVERGYHIDASILPVWVKKHLRPNSHMGVVAAVFCKLMEDRTLFDEVQQKHIQVDDLMASYLLSAVTRQYATSWWKLHLITKAFDFVLSMKLREGIAPSEERTKIERQWRADNPPHFRSAR